MSHDITGYKLGLRSLDNKNVSTLILSSSRFSVLFYLHNINNLWLGKYFLLHILCLQIENHLYHCIEGSPTMQRTIKNLTVQ